MTAIPSTSLFAITVNQSSAVLLCRTILCHLLAVIILLISQSVLAQESTPDFQRDIEPLLRKYCGNCHSGNEIEGDFSIQTPESLLMGTPKGTVIIPGKSQESKLVTLINGSTEPKMPPDEEPQPSDKEISLIAKWIDNGALVSNSPQPLRSRIKTPSISRRSKTESPWTSAVALTDGKHLIAGRHGELVKLELDSGRHVYNWKDFTGKITSLRLSPSGDRLIVAGGIEGVGGELIIIDLTSNDITQRIQSHSDILYAATLSPDSKWIATAGYDRVIKICNAETQQPTQSLTGHNGAIYDLDFDPSSTVLASASADETIKLWNISSGQRLDTLSQGEKEQYSVRFSRDGTSIYAGGADRKIRRWEFLSKSQPTINPPREARFAHESAVIAIRIDNDGRNILTLGNDGKVKQWTAKDLQFVGTLNQPISTPVAAEFTSDSAAVVILPERGPATLTKTLPPGETSASPPTPVTTGSSVSLERAPQDYQESEPNNQITEATVIELPAKLRGTINPVAPTPTSDIATGAEDIDLFRFNARQGETWIAEVKAARDKSPLDSRIEILDENGQPVLRVLLQAIRESYFTFRGKDSSTIDDFRLHKWQEMELNEFLYSDGEVVKLWLYPRGPDSGFKVYPGYGSRYTFFDTTPTAHALGAPAYIVQPLAPNQSPIPNGLPTFPIYFENDDDSQRQLGSDSRLTFTAPKDGAYFLRIRDSQAFGSPDHKYEVTLRPAVPDFNVTIDGLELTLQPSRGREFSLTAERIDGFDGPIDVELKNLPPGFIATQPLTIEAGQNKALGTIFAGKDATLPPGTESIEVDVVSSSIINGEKKEHLLPQKLKLRLAPADAKPEIMVMIEPIQPATNESPEIEIVILPGTTTSAKLRIERHGQSGPISFGNDDCGRNLPHGVFVDNIGLNGLLLPDGQQEREFFITAAPWVQPQVRYFHLRSTSAGNPTSIPVKLRIGSR